MAFLQICRLVNVGLDRQMVAAQPTKWEERKTYFWNNKTQNRWEQSNKTDEEMWTKYLNTNTNRWEYKHKAKKMRT